MTQIIIYTNEKGNGSVCVPTGEMSIEEVLAKDCPPNAIIVDDSILPQGVSSQFFNAWELNDGKVTVNFNKAQAYKLNRYNNCVISIAQKRQLTAMSGIENIPSDDVWLAKLASDRAAINSATTLEELAAVIDPE